MERILPPLFSFYITGMVTIPEKEEAPLYLLRGYCRYEDLIRGLKSLEEAYPDLVELKSLGKTREGREIPLLLITNREKGQEKNPGIWIGANIHGRELSGGIVALGFAWELLQGSSKDPSIRDLLDKRVFYIAPRLAPDAAEKALQSNPKFLRSGSVQDPSVPSGYIVEDIDRDGRILWIRWQSPTGPYKPSPYDPRLLVRREPDDQEGPFYHLLPEGKWFDEPFWSTDIYYPSRIDLNRNYPATHSGVRSDMAGSYPTSEPEVRSVVEFLTHHLNVYVAVDLHSYGGVILRPFSYSSDDSMPHQDLRIYRAVGSRGEELSGYPSLSTYHGFRSSPEDAIYGAFDDWFYEYLGGLGFTVEIFSPLKLAGVDTKNLIHWLQEHPLEDDLKMLAMVDRFFPGEGFVQWYPYEHPQLGPVEIGGWNAQVFFAPPPELFSSEMRGIYRWFLYLAHLAPQLRVTRLSVSSLDKGVYALDIVVQNCGYLPTYGLSKALDRGIQLTPVLNIKVPEGVTIINQKLPYFLPHLEGYGKFPKVIYEEAPYSLKNFHSVRFLLHSTSPFDGEVIVFSPRSGEVRAPFHSG
jgi:murein tripeptide amidase MpaA